MSGRIGTGGVIAGSLLAITSGAVVHVQGQSSQSGTASGAKVVGSICNSEPVRTSGPLAFPTAEGFGRFARGGRGGAVFAVTTLADHGPGSLRACAEASGPRTCVFRTSGTIAVDTWINVQNPYLTIAGQTSPGGIAIRLGGSTNTPLLIQTHDVVIRHLRIRPGRSEQRSENVDTVQISGGAHDVILDHVSTSWPTDEGINIVGDGHLQRPCMDTRNITVQWSILSEGLNRANRGPHSRGTYFGYGARDITFSHNLIANNYRRNPLLNTRGQFDMINNVIFNSQRYNAELYTRFGDLFVNAIGNVAVRGPSAEGRLQLYMFNYFRDNPARFAIFLKDNLDWRRAGDVGDDRLALDPANWSYVAKAPVGRLSIPAQRISAPAQAYRDIVTSVGANLPYDAADRRLLADMMRCKGAIIDDPSQVGGWPMLEGGEPPADQDGDGIPDAWELANNLSPSDPEDGRKIAGEQGYTNLELYLNALADLGRATSGSEARLPDLACGLPTPRPGPSPVVRISAQPAVVASGAPVTLSWQGEYLDACKLDSSLALPSGSLTVWPRRSRTYMIHCTGIDGGDAIDSVAVTAEAAKKP